MVYCVALDPGGTTGVCVVQSKSAQWKLETDEFDTGEHHGLLWSHLEMWKPEVIVCEAFEQNVANEAVQFVSLEYIGIVKAYAQARFTICELVIQSASIVKQFWTNKRLKEYGIQARGPHERDACRHYLYYQTFTRKDQSLLEWHRPRR